MARYWAWRLSKLHPLIVGQIAPPYRIRQDHRSLTISPPYYPWERTPDETPDVVLVATKWRQMPQVVDWLARHAAESLVVVLMNGMGQEEALADLKKIVPVMGTTTAAVTRIDTDMPSIIVQSDGHTILPIVDDPRQKALAGPEWGWTFEEKSATDWRRWKKLVLNSVINPLTALANIPNGILPDHPLWRLAAPLVTEADRVAQLHGITLGDDLLNEIRKLCEATQHNWSSMAQDVQAGLFPEIEAINGYVVRQAKIYGISCPTHEALTQLIKRLVPLS